VAAPALYLRLLSSATRRQAGLAHRVEELKVENKSEVWELEDLFAWATKVGRGEILPEEFVYLEGTDDDPLLVRRSAVTCPSRALLPAMLGVSSDSTGVHSAHRRPPPLPHSCCQGRG
jgi:hypothetical protein